MTVNKIILISVDCLVLQHGNHVCCCLIPKGAVATQESGCHIFYSPISVVKDIWKSKGTKGTQKPSEILLGPPIHMKEQLLKKIQGKFTGRERVKSTLNKWKSMGPWEQVLNIGPGECR